MDRYRWALRPRWILSHLFVLACIVAFVNLGFWQLRRLDERRASNAVVAAREQAAPAPVQEVVPRGIAAGALGDASFRVATATGTYRSDDEVLIRNRTNQGAPGYWVVTPLDLGDGTAVVVNRGWIPLPVGDAKDPSAYAPPAGRVTVTGLVRPSQEASGLEEADPAAGRLAVLSRVDVDRLGTQVAEPLVPAYLDLRSSDPAQQGLFPQPVPPPVLDDGPHLNYAGQWFTFALLTAIVYPLLLRRHARHLERMGPDGDGPADGSDGEGPAGGPGGDGAGVRDGGPVGVGA